MKNQFVTATSMALRAACAVLPRSLVGGLVARLIGDADIALCFHRVGSDEDRARMLMPELCHDASVIDEILEWFVGTGASVTMAFDDGYADAAEYIASRAPHHPDVTWLFSVCPQKTIDRYSFPWSDWMAVEETRDVKAFLAKWQDDLDQGQPGAIGDTGGAEREHSRLATVEECLRLAELDNVELGNHTDRHLPASWLADEALADEIRVSDERFTAAFGPADHFAFPFGTAPWVLPNHVGIALDTFDGVIWTIGSRPVVDSDRVRSRFPMRSTDGTAKATALIVAVQCWLNARRSRR